MRQKVMRRLGSMTSIVVAAAMVPAGPAGAIAAPATMTGEAFHATGGPSSVNCTTTGDFSFSASGRADGPYPGTFTETGSGTVSQRFGPVSPFSATFTILSSSGTVLATGTTALDPDALNTSSACIDPPNVGVVFGIPTAYVATIFTPGGAYPDQGKSVVGTLFSDPSSTFLDETFTSNLPAPVPLAPTDVAQCKNGGWRTYSQFKNQGDCVSFVVTHGRNAAARP